MPLWVSVLGVLGIGSSLGVCIGALVTARLAASREHKRWILDNKRTEWKDILLRVGAIEHEIPVLVRGLPTHQDFEQKILDVLPLLRSAIFVHEDIEANDLIQKWEAFLDYISNRFRSNTGQYRFLLKGAQGIPVSPEELMRARELSTEEENEVRSRFYSLVRELQSLAHTSLDIGPKH